MEHGLYPWLLGLVQALWWPFVRVMAVLAFAPVFSDGMVPMRVRVLVALVLAMILLPTVTAPAGIDVFSLRSVVLTVEQVAIGATLGLALQLATAALTALGFLVSSQSGLSMALMNDPVNGQSSDAITVLLGLMGMLVFFTIDGHLMVTGIIARSFAAWPVGGAFDALNLHTVAWNAGWVLAAAFLMAAPIVFAGLAVQFGFGLLARISPTLNLFSLGFSVVTLFGLGMLAYLLRAVPQHYIDMTGRTLDLLGRMMR